MTAHSMGGAIRATSLAAFAAVAMTMPAAAGPAGPFTAVTQQLELPYSTRGVARPYFTRVEDPENGVACYLVDFGRDGLSCVKVR